MTLRVLADTPSLSLTFLRVGHGPDPNLRSDEMTGLLVGGPVHLDWTGKRSTPRTIVVQSGDTWPSGLYAARLETEDGRIGFAPFVLRPRLRAAIASRWSSPRTPGRPTTSTTPTATAGATPGMPAARPPVRLDRPFRERGVPPRFRRYDFPFVRWLEKTRRNPDFYADDDLEAFRAQTS